MSRSGASPRIGPASTTWSPRSSPERLWARCQATGVAVHLLGQPGYPALLAADLAPPAVLFARGDLDVLDDAAGSRSSAPATPPPPGARWRPSWGRAWPRAGVVVVSGLARGIDGWAHRGALSRAAGRRRSASWPAGSTSSTRPSTAGSGTRSRRRASSSARCRRAPRPTPSASRCATASSPRSARWSSWSSRHAGRLAASPSNEAIERGLTVMAVPGLAPQPGRRGHEPAPRSTARRRSSRAIDVLLALGLEHGVGPPSHRAEPAGASARPGQTDGCSSCSAASQHDLDDAGAPVRAAARRGRGAVTRLEGAGLIERRAGWYERARARRVPGKGGAHGQGPPVWRGRRIGEANAMRRYGRAVGWQLDEFDRSLTAVSPNTVAAYRRDSRRSSTGPSGPGSTARQRSTGSLLRRYLAYLTTRRYAAPHHRPEGVGAAALLRLAPPHRRHGRRPGGHAARAAGRRAAAAGAAARRAERAARRATRGGRRRSGGRAAPRRRRARAAVRRRAAGGGGVRARHAVRRGSASGSWWCGARAQGTPGAAGRAGAGRRRRLAAARPSELRMAGRHDRLRGDERARRRGGRRPSAAAVPQPAGPASRPTRRPPPARPPGRRADASPRPAPHLRHPPARRRRRPPGRPGAARPRRPGHDADLHPRQPRAAAARVRTRPTRGPDGDAPARIRHVLRPRTSPMSPRCGRPTRPRAVGRSATSSCCTTPRW